MRWHLRPCDWPIPPPPPIHSPRRSVEETVPVADFAAGFPSTGWFWTGWIEALSVERGFESGIWRILALGPATNGKATIGHMAGVNYDLEGGPSRSRSDAVKAAPTSDPPRGRMFGVASRRRDA